MLGAVLLTGLFGGAIATHLRIGSPLLSHTLFGIYLGVIVWGGLWLRAERFDHLVRGFGPADLGDGHGAIESDHGRRLQALKVGIEHVDLRPVRILGARCASMQRCNGGLDLIGAGPAVAHGLVDQG